MRKIVFLISIIVFLFSCKKAEDENILDFFVVTYEGTSFPCTGVRSFVSEDDLNRLNTVLGIEDGYNRTEVGLVGLNGTYKKGDRIKVYVTQYKVPEDKVCPAFTPYPSVLVVKEERVN